MHKSTNIIYLEKAIANEPRAQQFIAKFTDANIIHCDQYTEIFNRKAQSFRLQKRKPAWILAKKTKNHVLPAPAAYSIGAQHNYYFSHMLNCLYDCRYCFLQGMYRSAHYVLFVNYQDFAQQINNLAARHLLEKVHFFSGYSCDSLGFDPMTGFIDFFVPVFRSLQSNALLELRTKSTQIRSLLQYPASDNIVIAFSFTPVTIAQALERKAPSIQQRLNALRKLQENGWQIGLRFDPLIYDIDFKEQYAALFQTVFAQINLGQLHSVSLGNFRLPKQYFKTLQKMYPDELLLASPLVEKEGMITYRKELAATMIDYCDHLLHDFIPDNKYFPCHDL